MAGYGGLVQLNATDDLDRPLVVDLDGTLVKSDLLLESLFARIGQDPSSAFGLLFDLRSGKAHFKEALAQRVDLDIDTLPYDGAVLGLIEKARAAKRPVFSPPPAMKNSCPPSRLGSACSTVGSLPTPAPTCPPRSRLRGWSRPSANAASTTLAMMRPTCLSGRPPPAGSASGRRPKLNGRLAALGVEVLNSPRADLRQWVKLIRVHQYAKNALVFLPLMAAHKIRCLVAVSGAVGRDRLFPLCFECLHIE